MRRMIRIGCFVGTLVVASIAIAALHEPPVDEAISRPTPLPGGPAAGESDGASRMLQADDFKFLPWRSVGPANMGGRVAAIAIAPGNSKTFFVGYGTGGLWKTTNRGTTLSPVFDKETTASIGSVVVADAPPDWPGWKDEPPSDIKLTPEQEKDRGKAKIVWVGTGEGNGRNSSSWGTGVYRSTDGGGVFKNSGLPDSHDIPRMAVDPRNPDVCYVAALGHLWGPNKERGVYKTSDGGKTWEPSLQIDENTGAVDIIIDPANPNTVFAAMYMRRRTAYSYTSGGVNGGIYRSKDAGRTWGKLSNGLPPQTGRIGLDICTKNSKIVCAVVESDIGGWWRDPFDNRSKSGGVFRSEDGGDTWIRVSQWAPRAFYFSKIRIDPTDDQRVYLLGYGLWISDDGGGTFRAGGARKPHGDLHALVIDPQDHDQLLLGTDGGIYASYDRGATWDFLNQVASGEFYNIALDDSEPYRIMGGLQDNGTWVGPSATSRESGGGEGAEGADEPKTGITNADWFFVCDGDGFHVAFDPTDKNILYAEAQGGELVRIHLDTGRRKGIRPSPKEGQPRFRFNWNSPFLISHFEPNTLYLGGNYVFKLTERGEKWERISEDLSTKAIDRVMSVGSEAETHGTVVSLAESQLARGTIWAGTDDGRIHVTTDDGKTWRDVTPLDIGGKYISKIETSHHKRDTVYVAVDGHRMNDMSPHLLVTEDAGGKWRSLESDLPADGHIKVVREDQLNPEVLYVGTERGAFVSIDRGGHWARINGEGLPTVAVDDIQQHPREHDLVLGTHGRSIWVLDDAGPLSQMTPPIVRSEYHLFDVRPAKPRLNMPNEGLWGDRFFRTPNSPMGAIISYWLRDYSREEVSIVVTDAKGTMIRKIPAGNQPGLNRVVWDLQREKFDRVDNPDERLGQTQFVPSGDYNVTLNVGKEKSTKTVTVLPAPRE
ncbi:MAG: hypothetical protein HY287_12175 [Planctomycetes bacterium]|nr:hypothetical protein [Planctomycetota bacterium]